MSDELSAHEWAALESFRVGDSGPLKELSGESFQRVARAMSWTELLLAGALRQDACGHLHTTLEVSGPWGLQVERCIDCGLLFTRPQRPQRSARGP